MHEVFNLVDPGLAAHMPGHVRLMRQAALHQQAVYILCLQERLQGVIDRKQQSESSREYSGHLSVSHCVV